VLVGLDRNVWKAAMVAHIYGAERMPSILVAGEARHSDVLPLQLPSTAGFYALYARRGVTGKRNHTASTAKI
jgi:hypothetical protein